MIKQLKINLAVSILLALFTLILPVFVSANDSVLIIPEGVVSSAINNVDIELEISKAVNAADYGYGEGAKMAPMSSGVAILTIFSDPTHSGSGSSGGSGFDFGTHSFITIMNISGSNIQVGNLSGIGNYKTVSVGTWGNKSEHNGLWYNLESRFVNVNGSYGPRVSKSYVVSASELATLNSYIINNDAWSLTNNCSSFAAAAWNASTLSSFHVSAGVPKTPKKLANNIMSNFPSSYQVGANVPWNYVVYYAQGTGAPVKSTVY